MPLAQLVRPEVRDVGRGRAGSVRSDAVRVMVAQQVGPESGRPIANIGVRIVATKGSSGAPPVECVGGTVLTDATGVVNCALRLGSRTGAASFTVSIGGAIQFQNVRVQIDP